MTRVLIALVGLITFVGVYLALQMALRQPSATTAAPAPTPAPQDALTGRIGDGHVAVALPVGGAQALVVGLQPGTQMDVLASVRDAGTGQPVTAVVARAVTVIQTVTANQPMLVSVAPADAMVLAHLVLGGTGLSYTVWTGGEPPAESPPLDEQTARSLLGLPTVSAPTPTAAPAPTVAPATATPRPVPTPTSASAVSAIADRYVVQPGETLASIAAQLGVDAQRLRVANPDVPAEGEVPAGMQLVVPQ